MAAHLLGGCTIAEIAEDLVVEVSTVRTHVKHGRAKSGTRSIVELVLWAVEHERCCIERPIRVPRAG